MPLAEPVSGSRLLVADVGGTNARFAIADLETIALFDIEEFKCARHSSLAEANQFRSTSSSPNSRPSRVQRWDSANTSRQPSRHRPILACQSCISFDFGRRISPVSCRKLVQPNTLAVLPGHKSQAPALVLGATSKACSIPFAMSRKSKGGGFHYAPSVS